ncbi:hypothetical protein BVRB_7g168450 [Beta vulgaris subsp. vulgaris]|uniref:probable disease resistance protein At1g52660 n=1 Tax=Beta vulgaris subsp. vulgaris TaxID=3555 RepID=UPI0005400E7E|nr:probable disease resistance protein At1g52660 [Beta vulgaris subsp. vulgaris]KMT04662.1 hypothetical protein BVRB_7g168450 [Beta vulgaris subsp. vulgaris]
MEPVAIFVGIFGLLTFLSGVASLDERKRILKGETESLTARRLDLHREISSSPVRRSKKRKRNDDLGHWMAESQKLLEEATGLLSQVGRWRCFFGGPKMRWDGCQLVYAMKVHQLKGDALLKQALTDAHGLCGGYHIPVKPLVGRSASITLNHLKLRLKDDLVGRIAIHGPRGIGKTHLMKHLHNCALHMFDYVFWVLSPCVFTIKSFQDAVAAVVNCDLSRVDDVSIRATKLSHTFASLGSRFALFLDGVPEAGFSLDHVGIPLPAEGSGCKLVLSTSSTLLCRMLDGFEAIKVERLPSEEAYQLFRLEARIGEGSEPSLGDMPMLLADSCSGVPHEIVQLATSMCGKDDPCEWSYALYQSGCLGTKNKLPIVPKVGRESKRLKIDMALCRSSLPP